MGNDSVEDKLDAYSLAELGRIIDALEIALSTVELNNEEYSIQLLGKRVCGHCIF